MTDDSGPEPDDCGGGTYGAEQILDRRIRFRQHATPAKILRMSEALDNVDADGNRWTRIAFGVSFFLPALGLLIADRFDRGTSTEPSIRLVFQSGMIVALLISVGLPVVVISVSKQTRLAKIGQILFFAVVWIAIQTCIAIVIGTASIMTSGLEGTQ